MIKQDYETNKARQKQDKTARTKTMTMINKTVNNKTMEAKPDLTKQTKTVA